MTKLGLFMIGALACAVGCGDDGSGNRTDSGTGSGSDGAGSADAPMGGGMFPVSGTVVGNGPADGKALVAWVVSSGSPDYVYKFGQGASTPTTFMVSFSGDPPAAALNSYGVGVGIVVILAPGTQLPPDGMVDDTILNGAGFSPDHAIIFKTPTATSVAPWMGTFPTGFACGLCVRAQTGFDSYQVTQCSSVQVQWNASQSNACNWT